MVLATAGPASVSNLLSFLLFSIDCGHASFHSVVVRLRFTGKWWLLHRVSLAVDSGAMPFPSRQWSPAFDSHGYVRAEVFRYGGRWPNSDAISMEPV